MNRIRLLWNKIQPQKHENTKNHEKLIVILFGEGKVGNKFKLWLL